MYLGVSAPIQIESDLGKRKNRWDQDQTRDIYGPGRKKYCFLKFY